MRGRSGQGVLLVFRVVQDIRRHAAAGEFSISLGALGVSCWRRDCALGRKLIIASLVLLVTVGFSPLGSLLLYSLESRFPPWDAARGAPDGIIILGGSIDPDISPRMARRDPERRRPHRRRSDAGAQYPNARIVFTGGSANLISNDAKEGDFAGEMLESLGIPKSRLTIERQSRNTLENAEFSKALVSPKPGERWLLVTSAYHMPRSVGLFRKAGFPVEPYPLDWRIGARDDLFRFTNIALEALSRTDIAVREWLG